MIRLLTATVVVAGLLVAVAPPVNASTHSVSGLVLSPANLPVAAATVTLQHGAGRVVAESDARGQFSLAAAWESGTLIARAPGFRASEPFALSVATTLPIVLRLRPARATIGAATTAAAGDRASRASEPGTIVAASATLADGTQRMGDALGLVPGIVVVGQGSSVSDDVYLSVRGFKPSETLTLLDGHPVGPLGVSPQMTAGFDYQSSPLAALQRATVTYGAGPSGRAAYDAIDGSIDLETIPPASSSTIALTQSAGSQASSSSSVVATGTSGALRYALAYGVQGTSGDFAPEAIAQTGLRGTDFTSATLRALTYPVSSNALVRTSLATVSLRVARATTVAFTSYTATSWFDKTGVDDNDFYPYAFELYQAKQNLGGALVPGGAHCPAALIPVIDEAHPDPAAPACITPAAYASGASGPAGGGPGAFQAMRLADEGLRLTTQAGAHTIIVDGYTNATTTTLVRPASYVQADAETTLSQLLTDGFDVTDVVPAGAATIGAGLSLARQDVQSADTLVVSGTTPIGANAFARLSEGAAFLSARGTPVAHVDVSASVLAKHFGALGQTAIDPQFALAYRPTPNDTLRILAGAASAEPSASARSGAPSFTSAGDLDPGNCSTFVVGSAPNPAVTSERGSDVELGYAHRFGSASVGATGYVTSVRDQIFDAAEPLAAIAGFTAASPALAAFYDRIRAVCPGTYGAATDAQLFDALAVTTATNAARALGRGVELRGDVRLTPALHVSATYAIDSMRRFDLPAAVLAVPSNATIVDGGQVAGIPVHQGSATFAYANARGLGADLTAHYDGPNNNLNLPGYAFADVAMHARVGRDVHLDVAIDNVFGSHVDTYGRVGLGLFQPENPFGPDTNALQQATERYGLAPTTIEVRLTGHFGR